MKYDAFISYRHLEKDMYVAKKVHRALETIKIPKKIQKEIGRKKINRVFRDQEELPIGSDLGANIEAALKEAAFLVVICSPQTKESAWVMKEIDTFIEMHGRKNILAVLVDGEPWESFPYQILSDENGNPVEPLAADVRGATKREINKKLKTETMRLAASIIGVDYDDLKQRHRERQMRRNVSIAAGVATVAVMFGLYTAYNLSKINAEYQQKLINESKVLAATSINVLKGGDRQTAALLAMAGLPSEDNERPFVPESMYALSQALDSYDISVEMRKDKLLTHHLQLNKFVESDDGSQVISVDAAWIVYLWDIETGEKLFELPATYDKYGSINDIYSIGFSDEAAVVIDGNGVRGYDNSGNVIYEYQPDDILLGGEVFKHIDIAAVHTTDTFILIDTKTGEVIKEYKNHHPERFYPGYGVDLDGTHAAVMHSAPDGEPADCTIYDLTTDKYVDVKLAADSKIDMMFTVDGQLAVVSMNLDDMLSGEQTKKYVQKFDVTTGNELWRRVIPAQSSLLNSSYTYVRSTITDINGEQCGRLIVNNSNTLFVLDLYTGEEINTFSSNSDIQRISFNGDGSYIFMATADGNVALYATDPTVINKDNVIKVSEDSLVDFDVHGGHLVASSFRSPDLILMKFSKDESMIYDTKLETSVSNPCGISPDGKTFIIESMEEKSGTYEYIFYVLDTKTGELKRTFTTENAEYEYVRYLDNDTIIIPDSKGTVWTYCISKDELNKKQYLDNNTVHSHYTLNEKYLLYYDNKNYVIFSLPDVKPVAKGDFADKNVKDAILSEDGKEIYYIEYLEDKLSKYNVADKSFEILLPDYRVQKMQFSEDSTYIAIACSDGQLRIYDTQSMECVDKIEFFARSYSALIKFSEDNKLLFLQGADLYFRIYDLEQKKFVFEFSTQNNEYDYCQYDKYNNRLILSNFVGMSIIDLDSMGELSYIAAGKMYEAKTETIISTYAQDIYGFKFKGLDELLQEAKTLYGDKELSDSQKLKYKID